MLPEPIITLIRDEQARQSGGFVEGVEFEGYLAKLGERAEILSDTADGRCRGFVAFYANDFDSKRAYITSVLVDPRDRGTHLGRALVACVLELVRGRGFASCRLEVARHSAAAHALYLALGFRVIEDRGGKVLMEIEF